MSDPKLGTVKRVMADRGFGFITPDDGGQDVHFNFSDWHDDSQPEPREDDRVEYVASQGPKGPHAHTVYLSDAAPSRTASPGRGASSTTAFASFYGDDGHLDPDVFFGRSQDIANVFKRANLTVTRLRSLFFFVKNARQRLRDDVNYAFAHAREDLGRFCRAVENGRKRRVICHEFADWVSAHRELAMSSEKEFIGFVEFMESLVAYLPDKEPRR